MAKCLNSIKNIGDEDGKLEEGDDENDSSFNMVINLQDSAFDIPFSQFLEFNDWRIFRGIQFRNLGYGKKANSPQNRTNYS